MQQYHKITSADLDFFIQTCGKEFVFSEESSLADYAKDHTEDLIFYPEVVVKPANDIEISKLMAYCNQQLIPVTPRGAGTGLSGGALPIHGGLVIALERLNKILEVDEQNFQAIVEPGVINEAFQQTVIEKGLFYPPDPASKGSCFLGGNLAHSSGGPRALKYGTTRDYVLNMEIVLPNGSIIQTGANTLKYSTGYNLTHLMIGSEGTLAIITKIWLKLISYPTQNLLLLASFESATKACEAIAGIFKAGNNPSVCEFVEPAGFELSSKLLNIPFDMHPEIGAYLLIEVDGNNLELLFNECEQINTTLEQFGVKDVLFAQTAEEKNHFWRLRRSIGEATKFNNVYKEEDTVVPRASLPILFKEVKDIGKKYGFRTICYGHAGDGNLHVNILKDQLSEEFWNHELDKAITEIFECCKRLGGTISGEHGIGYVQKKFMPIVMPEIQLDLMRKIKQAFDPNGILNPGKIW